MIPISLYTGFNQRPSDLLTKKEPYKKYFIICEGKLVQKSRTNI